MMWLPAAQYSEVLRKEQEYIDHLKAKWGIELRDEAEQRLRMGKRTELLGEIASEQGRAADEKKA